MTHLVSTGSRDGKNVIWKEKVSDAQYLGKRESSPQAGVNLDSLNPKQQALIPIAAFTANGNMPALKTAMAAGLDIGLIINEIKELHMHLYAYVGFPRALKGLGTLMQLVEERKQNGIEDELGKSASPMPADKTSLELGKAVQTGLVGKPVTGPLFNFAPMINSLLQSHLFGDLFGRDVLDYQSREIITLAALASIDGVESQFKSHLHIASNVGLSQEQLSALVAILGECVGKQAGSRAQQALQESQA